MTTTLDESRQYCQQLAKQTGKNFYYSFLTLPAEMRRDMCVLYAFMRITDDIGDDESIDLTQRRQNLKSWKHSLEATLSGKTAEHLIFPALLDIIQRRQIPVEYLYDVIEGVSQDLEPHRFETCGELEQYCYHVAGAVGLCCIHIWGFKGDDVREPAVACGAAFQLTNILRDIAEDADRSRVYLPQQDLQQFGYTEDDLLHRVNDDRFRALMQFEVARARQYYEQAEELFASLSKEGQPILRAMIRIYGGLLNKIEARNYDVYSSRVSLSKLKKWSIVARSFVGM
ncbi:MAG: phytoene/squalene synthase family protein [Planctomycetaceae bacterium]|nr:phytoene/squalene synthase family protein [Planctomycetaceae bacterium]